MKEPGLIAWTFLISSLALLIGSAPAEEIHVAAFQAGLGGRTVLRGRSINRIASVASFFLSRIDVLVDRLLRQRIVADRPAPDPDPRTLLGQVAIANAKLAYQAFRHILTSNRWIRLAEKGARAQRMLWASTSTKNPDYPGSIRYRVEHTQRELRPCWRNSDK